MKSILFNTDMVKATLCGQKCSFRSIVKPQPIITEPGQFVLMDDGSFEYNFAKYPLTSDYPIIPKYHAGDTLYVREPWGVYCQNWWEASSFEYKASWEPEQTSFGPTEPPQWRSSATMPKEVARLFLRVTGVRAERLQDIRDNDVLEEGVFTSAVCQGLIYAFRDHWDRNIPKGKRPIYGWDANPWVFVHQYERIDQETALKEG